MALRKSRDGSWIVDVSNGINPISLKQRRIVRKGFKTKKEALEAEQYLRSVELKEKSFNSKISIDILYDLLKEEDKINNRKQSYIDTQENNYNRHIKSYFEKVDDVSKLTYEDIYQFREHLRNKNAQNSEKKLSPNTINYNFTKENFGCWIKKGILQGTPCRIAKKIANRKSKIKLLDSKRIQALLNTI